MRNRKSNPDGVAGVHCDNKPRQISLNHNYNMTFLISPHVCPYSPLKWRSSRSKREPFRVLLPLLRHMAPLSDGKLLSHNAVVQGVQFMRTMRTMDGSRKLIGGAEMVPLNPFHWFEFYILVKICLFLIHQVIILDINNWTALYFSV